MSADRAHCPRRSFDLSPLPPRRKQAILQKIAEDKKRKAILKDRLRIESKVNEALQMTRVSKAKKRRLYWLRRIQGPDAAITADTLEQRLPEESHAGDDGVKPSGADQSELFDRNVSSPFILRQFQAAQTYPKQKNRRIHDVDNVFRELKESSYDILSEDAEQFKPRAEPTEPQLSPRQRAHVTYSGFSADEVPIQVRCSPTTTIPVL